MVDQKLTELTEATSLADGDLVYAVVDPAGADMVTLIHHQPDRLTRSQRTLWEPV